MTSKIQLLADVIVTPKFFFLNFGFCIQVTALSTVEAKKRFEFLEAVSGTMDAHLRYFKQVDRGSHSREFLPFSYAMTYLCLSLIFSIVANVGVRVVAPNGAIH